MTSVDVAMILRESEMTVTMILLTMSRCHHLTVVGSKARDSVLQRIVDVSSEYRQILSEPATQKLGIKLRYEDFNTVKNNIDTSSVHR